MVQALSQEQARRLAERLITDHGLNPERRIDGGEAEVLEALADHYVVQRDASPRADNLASYVATLLETGASPEALRYALGNTAYQQVAQPTLTELVSGSAERATQQYKALMDNVAEQVKGLGEKMVFIYHLKDGDFQIRLSLGTNQRKVNPLVSESDKMPVNIKVYIKDRLPRIGDAACVYFLEVTDEQQQQRNWTKLWRKPTTIQRQYGIQMHEDGLNIGFVGDLTMSSGDSIPIDQFFSRLFAAAATGPKEENFHILVASMNLVPSALEAYLHDGKERLATLGKGLVYTNGASGK